MARGRPGGNANIADYGFKSDRKYPLTKTVNFRVDEQTKEALKAGKLPGWTRIAREAVEKALAEVERQGSNQNRTVEVDLGEMGFFDGSKKKDPLKKYINNAEYLDGYSKGLIQYYKKSYEISGTDNNFDKN